MRELARARGWDPEVFDVCRQHVVAHDYVYSWSSPWKTSPDRRHQARPTYRISTPSGLRPCAAGGASASGPEHRRVEPGGRRVLHHDGPPRRADTLQWSDGLEVGFSPHRRVPSTDATDRLAVHAEGEEWTVQMPSPVQVRPPAGDGVEETPGAPVRALAVSS